MAIDESLAEAGFSHTALQTKDLRGSCPPFNQGSYAEYDECHADKASVRVRRCPGRGIRQERCLSVATSGNGERSDKGRDWHLRTVEHVARRLEAAEGVDGTRLVVDWFGES